MRATTFNKAKVLATLRDKKKLADSRHQEKIQVWAEDLSKWRKEMPIKAAVYAAEYRPLIEYDRFAPTSMPMERPPQMPQKLTDIDTAIEQVELMEGDSIQLRTDEFVMRVIAG